MYNISISDTTVTSEHIDVLNNYTRKITVFDTTVTGEYVDLLRAGARNVGVSDGTQTSEHTDQIRNYSRDLVINDRVATSENIIIITIQSPALICRTLDLSLAIPNLIAFSIININSWRLYPYNK